MNEYFRAVLVCVLYISCFFVGFSLFNLTGLSQSEYEVPSLNNVLMMALGVVGIILVSTKSEEPFWHTFIKLISQSFQYLSLMLCLVSITFILRDGSYLIWGSVCAASALTMYGLDKFKNSRYLNNA